MKVLFISAVLPYPLYSGGQVRIYNLLQRLSQKHEITLFAFVRSKDEYLNLPYLSFCHKVIPVFRGRARKFSYLVRSIFGKYPWLFETYNNQAIKSALNETTENYDLVHLEPSYVYPSLPQINIPWVVSEHNIEYQVYAQYVRQFQTPILRPFLNLDVFKLKKWEELVWKKSSGIVTVSAFDKDQIARVVPTKPITVIENGVDLGTFSFQPKKVLSQRLRFLYVGSFGWMQNRDAVGYLAGEVWPKLHEAYPESEFYVIGKDIPGRLRKQVVASGMTLGSHVEDIHEAYCQADVLVAPIRIGGGTKYKILEAMASGLPVITTALGAQGLKVKDKASLCLASGPAEVIAAVEWLQNNRNRLRLVESARSLIEKNYSWDIIAAKLDKVWSEQV